MAIDCEQLEMVKRLYPILSQEITTDMQQDFLLFSFRNFEIFKYIFSNLENKEIAFQSGFEGMNVLHQAAKHGELEKVKLLCGNPDEKKLKLIRMPIDSECMNRETAGLNAYEIAKKSHKTDVAEYLSQYFREPIDAPNLRNRYTSMYRSYCQIL